MFSLESSFIAVPFSSLFPQSVFFLSGACFSACSVPSLTDGSEANGADRIEAVASGF